LSLQSSNLAASSGPSDPRPVSGTKSRLREGKPGPAPGPRGHVLLGKLLEVRRDRLGFTARIAREFGDVARFTMGSQVLHLVSHPDLARHVLQTNNANYVKGVGLSHAKRWLGNGLVTSEGGDWARQRRLMQPVFQRARLADFARIVTDETAPVLERWHARARAGRIVDVARDMNRLTLAVITRALFGTRISDPDAIGDAFTTALRDAMDRMTAIILLPEWLPFVGRRQFRRALAVLDANVYAIIAKLRGGETKGETLLTMISSARDGADTGFTDEELRDQVLTLLLAGHETTAIALAWTFYLLSEHREAWRCLREETDRVLQNRTPSYDDLPRLTRTRMVLDEAMRLYPPVWLIPRRAVAPDVIGGYAIPAESEVLVSPYLIHRDARFWDRPDTFDPERFAPERAASRRPFTYMPFGAGPRACIGNVFATMEAQLVLATIVQRFRLELVPGSPVVAEPLLTLRLRHGLTMTPIPA